MRLGRHRAARHRRRLASAVALCVVSALSGGLVIGRAVGQRLDAVGPVPEVAGVLTPLDPASTVENFLLVGSDSREGADPGSEDFGGIGGADQTTGRRSDTIMVMRRDRTSGEVALLSLPRDLWVEIPGTGARNRINSAYSDGADVLVRTVQESLGMPVHHYLEVDFSGFKRLVDAIGGVRLCFPVPSRDTHTGLFIADPGCPLLDGVQALQYARSRYFEQWNGQDWEVDGTADIGRTKRQQHFVEEALRQTVSALAANPYRVGRVLDASVVSLRVDPALDLTATARSLRPVASSGLHTFSLPVEPKTIGGKAVLGLVPSQALPLIAYFQGNGPAPA